MKLFFALTIALSLAAAACTADVPSEDGSDDGTAATQQASKGGKGGGGGATRPGSHKACSLDSQCPSGEECRRHICQISDHVVPAPTGTVAPGACPPGFEVEVEHGVSSCKPHGTPVGGGGAAGQTACTTNADCAPGLECEVEVEHGVTTAFCKAHGGGK